MPPLAEQTPLIFLTSSEIDFIPPFRSLAQNKVLVWAQPITFFQGAS